MNILGTKIDGYCIALVLIILFFIYVDNDNVENYSNFAQVDNSEYKDEGDHEGEVRVKAWGECAHARNHEAVTLNLAQIPACD